MYLAGAGLSYLAWAGVHASAPRRLPSERLRAPHRRAMRWGGYVLGITVPVVCSLAMGAERGVFAGLGLLTLAGAALVFTVAIWPRAHRAAIGIALAVSLVGLVEAVV